MAVQLKEVNGTTVFFANTSLFAKGVGTLNESYLSITNPNRGVHQNLRDFRLNGHRLATIRTRAINVKTTIITISAGTDIRGLRTARFRLTVNGNRVNVSGVIDGKRIVPFTIRCRNGQCSGPDSIRFQNGGILTVTIDPNLERAIRRVSAKLSREVRLFLKNRPTQSGDCQVNCSIAFFQCNNICSIFFPPCLIACSVANAICLANCLR
ncbi:hypothetical protein [Paenibacillus sp. V4I5]|uniref:hypothetical protein n=1 Tax=Paenibacillus sp. V4I5 TaxID=3042306 RepID=UPI0027951516|nr:hypothetical protein [Paenibacillus sp. V4I5]MDQ0914772.1 hypothetical protein [Paenibacillus sp. V4I5]